MTRTEMLKEMYKKANNLHTDGWTREKENEIWDMCYEWNDAHYGDDEIFMCDYQSDDSEVVNGFMIEDDYWVFEE